MPIVEQPIPQQLIDLLPEGWEARIDWRTWVPQGIIEVRFRNDVGPAGMFMSDMLNVELILEVGFEAALETIWSGMIERAIDFEARAQANDFADAPIIDATDAPIIDATDERWVTGSGSEPPRGRIYSRSGLPRLEGHSSNAVPMTAEAINNMGESVQQAARAFKQFAKAARRNDEGEDEQ